MHKDNWRIISDVIVVKTRPNQGTESGASVSWSLGVELWAESALCDQNMYTTSCHDGALGIQKAWEFGTSLGLHKRRHAMMNVELRTVEDGRVVLSPTSYRMSSKASWSCSAMTHNLFLLFVNASTLGMSLYILGPIDISICIFQ